jgi:hypothetical protein
MAKSDSFFIRAQVAVDTAFAEVEIDLGSFVNLGVSKSTLLRIHNVSVQYADQNGPENPIYTDSVAAARSWQLTTQTQSGLIFADDKSVVASGQLTLYGDPTSTAHAVSMSESSDINPMDWRNGYLIGTDSMFLAADGSITVDSGAIFISIVCECTLENATQANSVALALSQQ